MKTNGLPDYLRLPVNVILIKLMITLLETSIDIP